MGSPLTISFIQRILPVGSGRERVQDFRLKKAYRHREAGRVLKTCPAIIIFIKNPTKS